jgi:hypothetical protein
MLEIGIVAFWFTVSAEVLWANWIMFRVGNSRLRVLAERERSHNTSKSTMKHVLPVPKVTPLRLALSKSDHE